MPKYKVLMHYHNGNEGYLESETEYDTPILFDSYEDAVEAALYECSCGNQGREDLNLSNPGDYPYDENDEDTYEIIEVED